MTTTKMERRYPVTLTRLVLAREEAEFDLETLCKDTAVGPDTLTLVRTRPIDRDLCTIAIQCREQPTVYVFTYRVPIYTPDEDATWFSTALVSAEHLDDMSSLMIGGVSVVYMDNPLAQVVEHGTEGNDDLTVRDLRDLAYEIGNAVMRQEEVD